jgi:hypothetical protein
MDAIRNFIDYVGQGDSIAAKSSIEELLSTKAFDALDGRKQDLASTLFTGNETNTEITDTE